MTVSPVGACAAFDEQCGELVLDLLPGEERAALLAHVAACARCRARLEELSRVVDELLVAGPVAEPPAGFEQRTLARLALEAGPQRTPAARGRRLLSLAAVVVVVLGVAAGIWLVTRAGQGGSAADVVTAAMVGPAGAHVGRIDVGGDPSTVFVALPGWVRYDAPDDPPVTYRLRFDLGGGRTAVVGPVRFAPGRDTWGAAVRFDPRTATRVEMVDASGRVLCHASLPG